MLGGDLRASNIAGKTASRLAKNAQNAEIPVMAMGSKKPRSKTRVLKGLDFVKKYSLCLSAVLI